MSIDLNDLNDARTLAVLAVPPRSRVLDLSASEGDLARALTQRGCDVRRLLRDGRSDLESDADWASIEGERFDAILALDVLAHLRAPETVLRKASTLLTANGVVVVSVPNITHAAARLMLLEGRFQYADKGLLDRAHVRLFDRRGAEHLIEDAKLVISERLRVTRAADATEIAVDWSAASDAVLRRIAADPDATTYEFVFVARRADSGQSETTGGGLAERLLRQVESLRQRVAEFEQNAKTFEETVRALEVAKIETANLQTELASLQEELRRRMQELQQKHLELRHSKADIAVKQAFIDSLREQLDFHEQRTNDACEAERLGAQRYQQLEFRHQELEAELRRLQIYASSAGFRFVEGVVRRLERFPLLSSTLRSIVRTLVRWRGDR